jgi:hypothetical protein
VDKRKTLVLLATLACILLTGRALAMDSANYRLDWFTPLTSNGGGAVSSGNYAINFTIGQTVAGTSASAGYEGCLGYWCGSEVPFEVYLPLLLKNAS